MGVLHTLIGKVKVVFILNVGYFYSIFSSLAHTVDLILLSHGDLAHAGLIPYAYSHWNLRAPAYCTLPVQAMSRISVTNYVESLRSEEAVEDETSPTESSQNSNSKKYIATFKQVHDAFDSFTALRYSQPTHLQGMYPLHVLSCLIPRFQTKANAKA